MRTHPSNTAPDNCNSEYFKALRWGVDSLYLSYSGELLPEVLTRLKTLKAMAQDRQQPEQQALAQYPVNDQIFEVKDKGAPLFPFVLENGCYRIQLSKGGGSVPMAYVKVSAAFLAHVGPVEAERRLDGILAALGILNGFARVSRIDLFVDFVWTGSMEWDRSAWITRAGNIDSYSENGIFTGWVIGRSGVMLARLYNKLLQSRKVGADYLRSLWEQTGWKEGEPVWRLEFQIKREVLTQTGLGNMRDTMGNLNGLWSYATTEWLRLAIPQEADQTRSRWPTHPLWGYLASVDWEGNGGPLTRSHDRVSSADYQRMYASFLAVLTSFAAARDYETFGQAHFELLQETVQHYMAIARYRGVRFHDLVMERIRLKARDFGTTLNDPDILAMVDRKWLDAMAAIYLKVSRGDRFVHTS